MPDYLYNNMQITNHDRWGNVHAPCTEHDWVTTKYRIVIWDGLTVDIPLRICDHCRSIIVTQRGFRDFTEHLTKKIEYIAKKERSGFSPLCRVKRRIKKIVARAFGLADAYSDQIRRDTANQHELSRHTMP